MLSLEEIKNYRNQSVSMVDQLENTKPMPISMALLLLFTKKQHEDPGVNDREEKKYHGIAIENESLSDFNQALKLAIEMDLRSSHLFDRDGQKIVHNLARALEEDQKNKAFFISDFHQAIDILEKNPDLSYQAAHVSRVLRAILMAYQAPLAEFIPMSVMTLDLPPESGVEHRLYFHCEHFDSPQNAKEALNRLYDTIVTVWNDGVAHDQLSFFLNSIQSGPCIEGATREALTECIQRQQPKLLPMRFIKAMDVFFHQADALLRQFNFIATPNTVKKCILEAYNGVNCLSHDNNPFVFSTETVQNYLFDLHIYDRHYLAESVAHPLNFPDDCSIGIRLALINAIQPYADPEHYVDLTILKQLYEKLCLLESPKAAIHTEEYVGIIQKTHSLNVPIKTQSPFILAIKNHYHELIEALIEFPVDSWCNATALKKNLLWLTYNECSQKIFLKMLMRQPSLITTIPAEAWYQPIFQDQSESVLYWLTAAETGRSILSQVLVANPRLITAIPVEAWYRSVTQGLNAGSSALYCLAATNTGRSILRQVLTGNPSLITAIPVEAWYRRLTQGVNTGSSVLYCLAATETGRSILGQVLTANPTLMTTMPPEAWYQYPTNEVYQNLSPFHCLASCQEGREILLRVLNRNSQLITTMTATIFLRTVDLAPYRGTLREILSDEDEQQIAILKLLANNAAIQAILSPPTRQSPPLESIVQRFSASLQRVFIGNATSQRLPVKKLILTTIDTFLGEEIHSLSDLQALEQYLKHSSQKPSNDAIGLLKQPRSFLSQATAELTPQELARQTVGTNSYQTLLKMLENKRKILMAVGTNQVSAMNAQPTIGSTPP